MEYLMKTNGKHAQHGTRGRRGKGRQATATGATHVENSGKTREKQDRLDERAAREKNGIARIYCNRLPYSVRYHILDGGSIIV